MGMTVATKAASSSSFANWLQDNWKTVAAVSAGAVVFAGVAYYVSSPPASSGSQKKQKKPKQSRQNLPGSDRSINSARAEKKDEAPSQKSVYPERIFPENIDLLTPKVLPVFSSPTWERLELAKEAKNLGNKFYGESKVQDAIALYSQAIKLNPDAVFFSNRAACYASLGKNKEVIEDCNEALKLDSMYIKAMGRRGQAYENLGQLEQSLNDFTVVCVLEEFKNEKSIGSTDRVLKELGRIKAAEVMKSKQSLLPSDTFITAYMDSFRRTSTKVSSVLELTTITESDRLIQLSHQNIVERKYQEAHNNCMAAVNDALSEEFAVLGYNLRGTFYFLRGETALALEDFNKAAELNPKDTNTLIKRASVFMEKGEIERAVEQFDDAQRIDTQDADLYYHRGQVRFLTGDLTGAVEDYERSIALDGNMLYANIQLGVSQYKMGDIGVSEATFLKATRKFSTSPEIYNYHGEILMDQQRFDE
ncbi:TOM (translocase of outer membrane) complex component, partial [Nowakowskiella sp. JEL0078]